MAARLSSEIRFLIQLLDDSFDVKAWHGPNLRGAIRGLSAANAAWRPAPGRLCIWELVLHCAYWEYAVWRRLTGVGPRGSFPRKPSNFPTLPNLLTDRSWKEDVALIDEGHARLRAAIAAFPASRLSERHGKYTASRMVAGIAAHNLYHTGQIRLLLRLSGAKRPSRAA
jgi:uncharacterized damage-inducible protein DinB